MLSGTVALNGNYGKKRIADLHFTNTMGFAFRYFIVDRHGGSFPTR